MTGAGLLAKVRFRMLRSGDPGITVTRILARDNANRSLNLEATVETGLPDHLNIPEVSLIYKNYPNPFNPNTTLALGVAVQGRVTVNIYSIDGRLVRKLVDEQFIPGTYRRIWDGTNDRGARQASGMYLARMIAPDKTQVHRMMLIK